MSFPGAILMGAQQRLLPVSIPYRFFLAACLFHVAAWGLLAFSAEFVSGYGGGPGPVLAVVHALTLGVFGMTAIGASFQMLPVATGRALRSLWPARAASWLYIPGVLALLHGFHHGDVLAMAAGAGLVVTGLCLLAFLVGDVLNRTRKVLIVLRAYGWAALASLLGLALMGGLAVADIGLGLLDDRQAVGFAHLLLAVYGFMGFLALGYSHILVPMFALSPAPSEGAGLGGFALAVLGLSFGVLGALTGHGGALWAGLLLGLAASGVYLKTMRWSLRNGMRKNLGLSFVLVKASWVLLPLSLLAGGVALAGVWDGRATVLFVFLTLFGWLLTFLTGILQRIIPFLAAMNTSGGRGMPRLSELAEEKPLKVHAVCHFAAVVIVAVSVAADSALWIRIGAGIGAVGALFYLWFALDVLRRFSASRKKTKEKVDDVSIEPSHPANPA